MFYPRSMDLLVPTAQPTGTGAQTITYRLKQEGKRRVESMILRIRVTTPAAACSPWGGCAGVVKEVRLRVSDSAGSRNVVQCSGVGLLGWTKANFGTVDRSTEDGYAALGVPQSTAIDLYYVIPIRHPLIEDPFGNVLSLPLSASYLGEDPILEVDLNDISGSGPISASALSYTVAGGVSPSQLQVVFREIPDSVPYLPSELKTDAWTPSSVGNATYEYGSTGWLTQSLIQGFSGTTFTNAVTRAALQTATGQIRLEYGRELLFRTDQGFNQAWKDLSEKPYPLTVGSVIASSFLFARNFGHEHFFDFLKDQPLNSAFSANSIKNLNPSGLGGDKMRLVINDWNTGSFSHITNHRLLPQSVEQLKLLGAGV